MKATDVNIYFIILSISLLIQASFHVNGFSYPGGWTHPKHFNRLSDKQFQETRCGSECNEVHENSIKHLYYKNMHVIRGLPH